MAQQVKRSMDMTDTAGTPRKMSRTEQDSDSDVEEFVPNFEPMKSPLFLMF